MCPQICVMDLVIKTFLGGGGELVNIICILKMLVQERSRAGLLFQSTAQLKRPAMETCISADF